MLKQTRQIGLTFLISLASVCSAGAQAPDKKPNKAPADSKIRMLYDRIDSDRQHWLVLADEKGVEVKSLAGFSMYDQWSPDGDRILVQLEDDDGLRELGLMGLDLKPYRVTRDYLHFHRPTWSADGKAIVFAGDGVSSISTDGKRYQQLCPDKGELNITAAYPSPDGKKLAVIGCLAAPDGTVVKEDVFVAEPDCSKPVRLTTDQPRPSQIRWSPDGKRLAFVTEPAVIADNRVVVIDADGRNRQEFKEGEHDSVAWTGDGRLLTSWMDVSGPKEVKSYPSFLGIIDPATGLASVLRKSASLHFGFAEWRPRKTAK